MLLGKRQRPPMKRTTSMTEFTIDLNHTTAVDDDDGRQNSNQPHDHPNNNNPFFNHYPIRSTHPTLDQVSATAATKIHRRNSADFTQTSHFLRACHLCKRRLIAGRDIFMYRGDSAFCSLECRQQQMNQDEKKDKCSMASNKHNTPVATTTSQNASETTVAAM